jgi:hypothetical protein
VVARVKSTLAFRFTPKSMPIERISMPEVDAELNAEGGKLVTITIAESSTEPVPDPDPNTFVIDNGKRRLTITIAE